MKTFYLAHNFGIRKAIRKWELMVEKKYKVNLNNPFYDSDRSDVKRLDSMKDGSEEQIEFFKVRNTQQQIDIIVDGDLELIRKSDGLVAFLKVSRNFTSLIGTPMEIFYASRVLQIPVYVITDHFAFHPWIRKYATKIFSTEKEFEDFLRKEVGVIA